MSDRKTIGLSLFSYYDLSTQGARANLLRILLDYGGVFAPERIRTTQGMRRFTSMVIEDWIDKVTWPKRDIDNLQHFEAHRSTPCHVDIKLGWAPEVAHAGRFFFSLFIDTDALQADEGAQAMFLKLSKDLYLWCRAAFGAIHDAEESLQQTLRLPDCLSEPLWGNFYGPEYVDMFGRERVLNAPCHSIELLPDGGIFLVLSEDINHAQRIHLRSKIKQLKEYLGPEAFDCDTKDAIPNFRFRERTVARSLRELVIPRRHYYQGELLGWAVSLEEIGQAIKELEDLLPSATPYLDFTPNSLSTLEQLLALRWQADHDKLDVLTDESLIRLARDICAYLGETCVRNLEVAWVTNYTPIMRTSLRTMDASGKEKWLMIMDPIILCWDEDFPSGSYRDRLRSAFESVKTWKSN